MTPRPESAGMPPAPKHKGRIAFVLAVFLCGLGAIVLRLVNLHTEPAYDFSQEDRYHIGWDDIPAPRGDIRDVRGSLAATDRQVPSLAVDPAHIEDPAVLAGALAGALDMDEAVLRARFEDAVQQKGLRFLWVKRWLHKRDLKALQACEELPGVLLREEPVRFYPQGSLAAHVLGFVNREQVGSAGVELTYDKHLRSTAGKWTAWKDRDQVLLPSRMVDFEAPKLGDDVHLTLDLAIQDSLERELDAAIQRCKAETGMGILLNPDTGAIYALACRPAYDPNRYNEFAVDLHRNRAVLDVFEPGSAFKVVTAAAVLENGLITPETTIDCEGGSFYPYGRRRINDTHPLDEASFSAAFAESSNVAIVKLAMLLGGEGLDAWIRRFGFGETTSRDFGVESPGIYRPLERWSKASIVSLPMGQEVAVTMLQLARAYAAIANGGWLVEPHVVERITNDAGEEVYRFKQPARPHILHESTARKLQVLCHEVVTHGTGKYAHIPEYRVGGKTGTAQIAKPDGSGYYEDRYTTVFAGFAPLRDPAICGVIVVRAPQIEQHYGGYVCGPVFRNTVRYALSTLHVPEDPAETDVRIPGLQREDADTLVARLELGIMDLEPGDLDPGGLEPLERLEPAGLARDLPERTGPPAPDFIGLTKRQAYAVALRENVRWAARGSGWVVYQDPAPGAPLGAGTVCRLIFSNDKPKTGEGAAS